MEFLLPFVSHNCFPYCDGFIFIFDGCYIKIIFTQISSYIKVFNLGKNMARQYFIFKIMFVIGYNNQFTVVRRRMFCKLFVKENCNKLLGINPMGLSEPRSDCLEIIAVQPVKKIIGINPMIFSAPWTESIDIIALYILQI